MFNDGISFYDSDSLSNMESSNYEIFRNTLDNLGIKSGIAQELNGPITSCQSLIDSITPKDNDGHHLLIYCENNEMKGYIKYCTPGSKNLYFYSKKGAVKEFSPYCLLDFYVLDTKQRSGIGIKLFKRMLQECSNSDDNYHGNGNPNPDYLGSDAGNWAYDRPSPKLLPFLKKHFNLNNPDLQPNKYVIFLEHFYNGILNDKK